MAHAIALLCSAVVVSSIVLAPGQVLAQSGPGEPAAAETSPGDDPGQSQDDVLTDPQTGQRYRATRPPPGLRRGWLPVPGWVVLTAGGLLAGGALAALLVRRGKGPK